MAQIEFPTSEGATKRTVRISDSFVARRPEAERGGLVQIPIRYLLDSDRATVVIGDEGDSEATMQYNLVWSAIMVFCGTIWFVLWKLWIAWLGRRLHAGLTTSIAVAAALNENQT